MAPALLSATNCKNHIHLVVGSNPLAAARCSKSLEVGARPKLLAAETCVLHHGLIKRIEDAEVEWLKRGFEDSDIRTLGREDVDFVVDAVFVTLGAKDAKSATQSTNVNRPRADHFTQVRTSLIYADVSVFQSMSRTLQIFALSRCYRPMRMGLFRSASRPLERAASLPHVYVESLRPHSPQVLDLPSIDWGESEESCWRKIIPQIRR